MVDVDRRLMVVAVKKSDRKVEVSCFLSDRKAIDYFAHSIKSGFYSSVKLVEELESYEQYGDRPLYPADKTAEEVVEEEISANNLAVTS